MVAQPSVHHQGLWVGGAGLESQEAGESEDHQFLRSSKESARSKAVWS